MARWERIGSHVAAVLAVAWTSLAQLATAVAQPAPEIYLLPTPCTVYTGDTGEWIRPTVRADDIIWVRPDGGHARVRCRPDGLCQLREWFGGAGEYRIGYRLSAIAPSGTAVTFTGRETWAMAHLAVPQCGDSFQLWLESEGPAGLELARAEDGSHLELQNGSDETIPGIVAGDGTVSCHLAGVGPEPFLGWDHLVSEVGNCVGPPPPPPTDLPPGAAATCDGRIGSALSPGSRIVVDLSPRHDPEHQWIGSLWLERRPVATLTEPLPAEPRDVDVELRVEMDESVLWRSVVWVTPHGTRIHLWPASTETRPGAACTTDAGLRCSLASWFTGPGVYRLEADVRFGGARRTRSYDIPLGVSAESVDIVVRDGGVEAVIASPAPGGLRLEPAPFEMQPECHYLLQNHTARAWWALGYATEPSVVELPWSSEWYSDWFGDWTHGWSSAGRARRRMRAPARDRVAPGGHVCLTTYDDGRTMPAAIPGPLRAIVFVRGPSVAVRDGFRISHSLIVAAQ